tara:strand:- start:516 stop:2270 length:1755 start_codon:yes stop_codon:yes gene_type:complete
MNTASNSYIDKFTINLNEKAKNKKIDPVFGRDKELKKMTSILLRRRKNNVVILGEPGVGKTALAEDLALKIVNNTSHEELFDKTLLLLDLVSMMSGTQERGALEKNITGFLKEIEGRDDIILMIDEIHMLNASSNVGGNKDGGNLNVANILKPGLARGDIKCIGTTTYSEYVKYFSTDKALSRRFQPLFLEEPTKEETIEILKIIKPSYEEFHKCIISDEAIKHCVYLAERYIPYRNFPDKAIDLMDEACSCMNVEKYKMKTDDKILEKEDIEKVFQYISDVPLKFMDEINKINNLENKLRENIVGQNEVIDILTQSIKRYTCGFYGKNRPIVSMMFIGPTGTGKTEVVNLLGEHYFGSRKNIIRFDMSEYQDANSVSKLIGAPPGFIGYEEGGALTNQIKNNPFSVVLFDEFEKAHYKVYDLLLQILEEGNLTDSYGKTYSFQNAIIIMTSNVGFTHKKQSTMGYVSDIECAYNKDNLFYELKHVFRPEFLNRIDNIVPFEYLTEDNIIAIADNLIINTVVNIKQTKNITVTIDEKIKQQIYTQGMSTNYGARPLRSAILSHIIDPVAEKLLNEPLIKEINLT